MKTQAKKEIRVKVHFTAANLDEMELKGKNIVIIDVLRAGTTIAMALKNGAKEIIPVSNIENAVKISGSLFGGVTLRAGERNSKRIEGFNLGNSPGEYTEETVKGKSIILLTSNGSGAIVKAKHASKLVIAGFANMSAVVDFLVRLNDDFIIICAGQDDLFCMEDAVCAGRIINKLGKALPGRMLTDDAASASALLDKALGRNILNLLKNSDHGKYLAQLKYSDDLKVCGSLDSIGVLPVLIGNVIRLQK